MNPMKSCGCGCGSHECGCCQGVQPRTPVSTANAPGQPALAYRVGTHGSFLETMKARLSLHELPGGIGYDGKTVAPSRPLATLTTRESTDASIGLIDAWATVADVLTFYQERIANEGFLRTATEMRSVFELSRLVGYRPRPGVAASVYLAYTIDTNTHEEVLIPLGARAQSVPGPGELPQSFETSEELKARATWNNLKVRLTQPQQLVDIETRHRMYLKGVTTGLNLNDPLLVVDKGVQRGLYRIVDLQPDTNNDRTLVKVELWQDSMVAGAAGPARDLAPLEDLLNNAPAGAVAGRIVEGVRAVIAHAGEALPGDALPRVMVERANAAIDTELAVLRVPAPNLRPWAAEVRDALNSTVTDARRAAAAEGEVNIAMSSLVTRLARPASSPRANALQLPRSLAADFRPTSDAGLKVLGAIAPTLRSTLGPTLAGQTDVNAAQSLEVHAFRVRAGLFGRNAPKRQAIVRDAKDERKSVAEVIGEWPIVEMEAPAPGVGAADGTGKVVRVNESAQKIFLDMNYDGIVRGSWVVVDTSTVTPAKPTLVRSTKDTLVIAHAKSVHAKISRAVYGISGDTIRLDIDQPWVSIDLAVGQGPVPLEDQTGIDLDFRVIRGTTVFARSEKLTLAPEPIEDEVCDGSADDTPIELDGLYQDLEPGRFAILSGNRADLGDGAVVSTSEAVMIRAVTHDVRVADAPIPWTDAVNAAAADPVHAPLQKLPDDTIHTFIWFDKALSYCYRRDSVSIRANVVRATHGETRNETLGNGDGTKTLQRFALKQFPLTYLAAPTATGADSTLDVLVNDVRWHERTSFVMTEPTDRIFITKADEEGKATVIFGNGREGARLPTGMQNVQAVYRNGIGKPGNVRAEQISQLSTRPLGVRDVINPLRASGGADRESLVQARRNAPNAVMALDRLVSTRDYADFSRNFAGIGKAAAVELPAGRRTVVHVTIAGVDDIPIDVDSDLFRNLHRALETLGDPFQPVRLATRELLILVISAKIRIDPNYVWERVVRKIRAKLLAAFGFEQRDLGQDATSSDVLATMQGVRGVLYVDLDSFGVVSATKASEDAEGAQRPKTPDEIADGVQTVAARSPPDVRVVAAMARPSDDGLSIRPAQLAMLLPDVSATLVLNQIK